MRSKQLRSKRRCPRMDRSVSDERQNSPPKLRQSQPPNQRQAPGYAPRRSVSCAGSAWEMRRPDVTLVIGCTLWHGPVLESFNGSAISIKLGLAPIAREQMLFCTGRRGRMKQGDDFVIAEMTRGALDFEIACHTLATNGSKARRSLRTARKTLCFAALRPIPSAELISSTERPS